MNGQKINSLKYKELYDFSGAGKLKKRGVPQKMKVYPEMCMKTKIKKNRFVEDPEMSLKKSKLYRFPEILLKRKVVIAIEGSDFGFGTRVLQLWTCGTRFQRSSLERIGLSTQSAVSRSKWSAGRQAERELRRLEPDLDLLSGPT